MLIPKSNDNVMAINVLRALYPLDSINLMIEWMGIIISLFLLWHHYRITQTVMIYQHSTHPRFIITIAVTVVGTASGKR